jgi:phage shock protein PspC (stress-responsive transcriptional regulator)
MTETLMDPPPSPPPPTDPRRLVRDPHDRVVAGVCAAAGRYTGTDPVLWRVAVAVLALFGGAGLALYALGWLLIPRVGEPQSVAERVLRRQDRGVTVLGVVATVIVAVVLLALLDNGPGAGALLVLGGIAYLVARERREVPAVGSTAVAAAPGGPFAGSAPVAGPPPAAWAPPPPRAPRERSPLGGITLSAAIVVTGVLLALRVSGVEELTAPRIVAAVLLVLGAGLLVGTWWGRARWLLPVGLMTAVVLAGSVAAERIGFDGSVGERSWRAVDGSDYALGAGEATLDLRGLRGAEDAQVEASVGLGHLLVLVPTGMSVAVTADVDAGEIVGDGVDFQDADGDRLHEEFVVGSSDDVTVTLDLEVGLGQIEVRRVAS